MKTRETGRQYRESGILEKSGEASSLSIKMCVIYSKICISMHTFRDGANFFLQLQDSSCREILLVFVIVTTVTVEKLNLN